MRSDLSAYTIRLASPAQWEGHLRAAFVPWNRGKDWQGFQADQLPVRDGPWAHDGALRCWVLVRRDDMEGPIYSGCETNRRKTILKQPGSDMVEDVYSYGISSVVTPKEHHRQGFATYLLQLLHYQLGDPSKLPSFPISQWGEPPAPLSPSDRAQFPFGIASVLYSDVGSTFYERATIGPKLPGWVVDDSDCQQLSWNISKPRPRTSGEADRKWDWLYVRDLPSIEKKLSTHAHKRLAIDHKSATIPVWAPDPANPGIVAFVPTTAMWYYGAGNIEHTVQSDPCGIRLPPTSPSQEEAIVLFVGSLAPIGDALIVTCVHNLDQERLPVLLEALDEEGTRLGKKEGWVWGLSTDEALGSAWLSAEGRAAKIERRQESKGHLLGIAWYGSPESRGRLVDTQMWSWC